MQKVFVTRKLLKENEQKLQELFEVKLNTNDKIYSAEEIIEGSKDCDGILSSVTDPINADTISKLSSSIKIIANGAVGFGNIDFKAARAKGISVTNTPDVLTDATADIQILLLLGASRKAYEGRVAAETQNWKWSWDFLLGKQMSNKRLGILGMGRIGRAVAKRARGFNMEIHYHNRNQLSKEQEEGAIYHKTIKDLFGCSDFLSINCPATKETFHLMNDERFKLMKKSAFIINTARGDIIDEKALVNALVNKEIAGAALDVFETEPNLPNELKTMENVVSFPHLGSATSETRIAMGNTAIDNTLAFFAGTELPNKVV